VRIKEFLISNYKCFGEGDAVRLQAGMTVLTGRNSSGKTATLEALSLRFVGNPHRSLASKAADDSPSVVQLVCELTRAEFSEYARQLSEHGEFYLPALKHNSPFAQDPSGWIAAQDRLEIRLVRSIMRNGGRSDQSRFVLLETLPLAHRSDGDEFLRCTIKKGQFQILGSRWQGSLPDWFPGLTDWISSFIYRFSPERYCASVFAYGDNEVLKADASNLPEVLNHLQADALRFRQYNGLVSKVLPQVKWVRIRARTPNNEIWVSHLDPEVGKNDLWIPLADCGTGVGHVLAILYVLFASKSSQTILIDEPQSFLHPGAARKLMDVLSEFPHHQLLIATHSPTIISSGAVRQVLCINTNGTATISTLPLENATERAALLNELGARLSDVYGADNILWVEGPAEEECFPKILHRLALGILSGTAILAVRKTGDLEGKDAGRVFEIYGSLSKSGSLVPPTIAFLFDSECWSEAELRQLTEKSQGLLRTTGRRTYENFLLHWEGIAWLINKADTNRQTPVTVEDVQVFLEAAAAHAKYGCKNLSSDAKGLFLFDAPRALRDMFNHLTEARVAFSKTTHSVALTDWILENDQEFLRPIADVLGKVLSEALQKPQEKQAVQPLTIGS
jgi:predicted ATPase